MTDLFSDTPPPAHGKHYCALARAFWTHGRKTDVLARSPACGKWEVRKENGNG